MKKEYKKPQLTVVKFNVEVGAGQSQFNANTSSNTNSNDGIHIFGESITENGNESVVSGTEYGSTGGSWF